MTIYLKSRLPGPAVRLFDMQYCEQTLRAGYDDVTVDAKTEVMILAAACRGEQR